jgi:hypothetical protein
MISPSFSRVRANKQNFGPVFEKIDGRISYQLDLAKAAEHRTSMADALDLIRHHRIFSCSPSI